MPEFEKYAKVYDRVNKKKNYPDECEFVYRWGEMPKQILDIGCGTAHYWQYFPVKPIGIEKSAEMILNSKYASNIIRGDVKDFEFSKLKNFDCAFALFDVINYIDDNTWWEKIPLKKGGYFIFDIWDSEKVKQEGFAATRLFTKDGIERTIIPNQRFSDIVNLDISIVDGEENYTEKHTMYIHSKNDIRRFCGNNFKMADIVKTNTWQVWYKIVRL